LAFLYPGEGAQYPGMLADLCPHFPEVRRVLDTADRVATERGHARLPSELLYNHASDAHPGLWVIESAVNLVLSTQWGLHQVLPRVGVRPDAVVGQSSGEILALAAADVIRTDRDFEDRLGALGSVFEQLESAGLVPNARLVAVAADRARVEPECRGTGVSIAIDNCPHQVVVAGPPGDVERLIARLKETGLICEELPFARAYHTPAFSPALEPVRGFFGELPLSQPSLPVYSCATAERLPESVDALRALAVEQWARPVRFRETIEAMYADGVRL